MFVLAVTCFEFIASFSNLVETQKNTDGITWGNTKFTRFNDGALKLQWNIMIDEETDLLLRLQNKATIDRMDHLR